MSKEFDRRVTDFFAHYQDRGMKKWAGFFLSDHTARIKQAAAKSQWTAPERTEMTREECDQVLCLAFSRHQPVTVQLKELDANGARPQEIAGFVAGYTEDQIIIGGQAIDLANLRHVELLTGLEEH